MKLKITLFISVSVLSFVTVSNSLFAGVAFALTQDQKKVFDSGVPYFDVEDQATNQVCANLLAGSNDKEKIWNYLVGTMGFSAIQAAGIMGNIQQESGFSPTAVNRSSGAYGIIQWLGSRKTNLENFAREQGKDKSDLSLQLDFMKKELEESYKESVLDPIKATEDLKEVTRIWLEVFERPCIAGSAECISELNNTRLPFAQDALNQYGSDVSGTSGGLGGCASTGLDGVQCPAVLEPHASKSGYFKFPEAPNGEYTIYSSEARRYGSQQLVCVIYSVAMAFDSAMQGRSKLRIGDLNASGHKSHKWGVAVDLSGAGELQVASHTKSWKGTYDKDATVLLGKLFADTGVLRNIWWCDPGDDSTDQIKAYAQTKGLEGSIKCIDGHDDHFHIDIKQEFRLEEWTP